MRFPLYILFALSLSFGFLASCNSDEKKMEPVAAKGASALAGQVLLADEFQSSPVASADVEVKVLKFQSDEEVATVKPDAGGYYRFENLQPGAYRITYALAGYPSITRPRVDHGGGTATTIPLTYLTPISTTQVSDLKLDTLFIRRVTYFRRDRQLAANEVYSLRAGVLYYFYETGQDGVVRRLGRTPAADSAFSFPLATIINIGDSLITNERNLRLFARISPSNDSVEFKDRGVVFLLGDASNVSAANAKLALRAYPNRNRDTVQFDLTLADLESAGILRLLPTESTTENRGLFVRAFGTSGRRSWYGAYIDPTSGNVVVPTLNPVGSVEEYKLLPARI